MPTLCYSPYDSGELLARLQAALGATETTVGTPLADALSCALELDRRAHGDPLGLERHLALTRIDIVELGFDLNCALMGAGSLFQLPLGTEVTGNVPGQIEIQGEAFVLDADRPGLFPLKTTSPEARGRNLELLRSEIDRQTRKLACRRIGLPSAVQITDGDLLQLLQFPPLSEACGVVLQRSVSDVGAAQFCAASPQQIKDFAHDIILDMRALWTKRRLVGKQVDVVRKGAESAITAISPEFSVRSIDVEMKYQREATTFALKVEYNAIDEALRPGIALQGYVDRREHDEGSFRVPRGIPGLVSLQADIKAWSADGWINDLALAIVNAAPEGASSVRKRLAASYETVVTFKAGRKTMYATLFWHFGCIEAEVFVAGQLDWSRESLTMRGATLPEPTLAVLPGHKLTSVIELPFECACEIIEAESLPKGNGFRIEVDLQRQLIDLESGRTWPEPSQ